MQHFTCICHMCIVLSAVGVEFQANPSANMLLKIFKACFFELCINSELVFSVRILGFYRTELCLQGWVDLERLRDKPQENGACCMVPSLFHIFSPVKLKILE